MGSDIVASACPLDCPDLCSLEVTVDGGKVMKVDGGWRSPITDGFICGKVRHIAQHLYGPDRVLTPLVRDGRKGEGQFRTASWDAALELVVSRLRAIVARVGGAAILPYHYGGSNGWLTEGALASRFFRRIGSSNLARTLCAAATAAATHGMYGKMPGVAIEDYVHARLVVLWGVNPSATGIHLIPILERAREAGARLVVVDPRRTALARRADLHLQLRPGTDLPVALAIIDALFARGLADEQFLTAHCAEVEELRRRAARWPIAAAAREAGVAASDLERFVELWAGVSPAVVRCGWGIERNRNGGSAVCAVLALPAVAGKHGVRGGGMTMSNGDVWTVGPEPAIAEPLPERRTINMSRLASALREVADPRLEALFVYNCNPVATAPNQVAIREELGRDDLFVVVHDQVMTDTARWADVVLPATAFLEHRDVKRGYGTMRLYDSPAVAVPPGQARSNNQLFGELLRRMDLCRPGDPMTDDELVQAIFDASPAGPGLRAQLEREGAASPTRGARPIPFVDAFPTTRDGKVHLVPAELDSQADGGLYAYKPDPGSEDFPLALISPALSTQISSTFGQLRKKEFAVEIALADAAARGIRDGDEVRVWNQLGEVLCAAKLNADLRPGVAFLPKGLWSHHTRNGNTANALVPETLADLGGQAAYNDARVQIARS